MTEKSKSNASSSKTTIESIFPEILLQIFMLLNVEDRVVVSRVCKSWKQISQSPSLWHKLDLSELCSTTGQFNIPKLLNVWYDNNYSRDTLISSFMKRALSLSNGSTECFIFNFYIYLTDAQLIYVARRTLNLKRLVLPIFGHLTKHGIDNAMKSWKGLESVTITPLVRYHQIVSAIEKYCKNVREIKFTYDAFELHHGEALVKCAPNLKVLSIKHMLVDFEALNLVFKSLQYLEVVNVCHSFIWNTPIIGISEEINEDNLEAMKSCFGKSFQKLIYCDHLNCLECKDGGCKYFKKKSYEDFWRNDEIASLAH